MDSQYKIQVPRIIPKDALTDKVGRHWMRAEDTKRTALEAFTEWETDEDMWYVWFPRKPVPFEDEEIQIGDRVYIVERVIHWKRAKRAMVVFKDE